LKRPLVGGAKDLKAPCVLLHLLIAARSVVHRFSRWWTLLALMADRSPLATGATESKQKTYVN
jgi:hypothetical protein